MRMWVIYHYGRVYHNKKTRSTMDYIETNISMYNCHISAHPYLYCVSFEFQRLYILFCITRIPQVLHKYRTAMNNTSLDNGTNINKPPWLCLNLVSFYIKVYETPCNINISTCLHISGKRGPLFSHLFLRFPFPPTWVMNYHHPTSTYGSHSLIKLVKMWISGWSFIKRGHSAKILTHVLGS